MSVRVRFELLIPGFETVEDIRNYVSMEDSQHDEEPIDPKYVKGSHVLQLYFLGKLPNVALDEGRILTGYPWEEILVDELEEA